MRELVEVQTSDEEREEGDRELPPKRSRLEEGYEEYDVDWASSGIETPSGDDEVSLYLKTASSIPSVETLLEWWRTKVPSKLTIPDEFFP